MRASLGAAIVAFTLLAPPVAAAQDLGHRLVGTQGLHAGRQRDPGLYVADQLIFYTADTLRDRDGAVVPIEDLQIDALANALGVSAVFEIAEISTYVAFAAALPLARASISADQPEASLDRTGLGDVFLQPLLLGWRVPHLDVIAGYSVYLPTGLFRLGEGGVSRGHTTHELSLGSTVHVDVERQRFFVSAIASYDLNQTKEQIDIRRGDTVQVQGGAGATLAGLVDVGLTFGALWQVQGDEGADVPPALDGARDRSFALGGELGVMLPSIGGRIGARYVRELDVRARPEGQIIVFQLALRAWQPAPPAPEPTPAPQ